MTAIVPHVRLRNGVYQYERRVPEDIVRDSAAFNLHFDGCRLFRRSLKTKDQSKVLIAAEGMRRSFEVKVAAARGRSTASSPSAPLSEEVAPLRAVTPELLAQISNHEHDLLLRPWQRQYLLAQQDAEHADELIRMADDRELFAEEVKRLIVEPGARSSRAVPEAALDKAEQLVADLGLDAPQGSNELSWVAVAVRKGMLEGHASIDRLLAGQLPLKPLQRAPAKRLSGPTLRDAVALYVSGTDLRPKSAGDVRTSLELFEQKIGNKRLSDLTRQDFKLYVQHLAAKQVGGRSRGSVPRMIGPGTIKKRLAFLRAAINHAIEMDLHEGGNPATGIDISKWVKSPDKALMPDKRRFRVGELNAVLRYPWFTGCQSATQIHSPGKYRLVGSHYWAPIVALLTGCRASELGGLMLAEIDLVGTSPSFHIRDNKFRPTKGSYARFVPVLDALLELGFREYFETIRNAGHERLFPDWEAPKKRNDEFDKNDAAWSNASMIRSFNSTVIPRCLGDTMLEGARREVTFHSFRGAFKAMLGSSRYGLPPNFINEVIGHAKDSLDQRYVGTIDIGETYAAMRHCRYEDLTLPPPPI